MSVFDVVFQLITITTVILFLCARVSKDKSITQSDFNVALQLTKSFVITFYYHYVICFAHHICGMKERYILRLV